MIPSLDTYLYKEIKERLRIILSECYIIDEALRELDKQAKEDFIETYTGENPKKEVKISYTFPQNKEQFDGARYVISLGGSTESRKAIGGIIGTYEYREDDFEKEMCEVVRDGDYLKFATSKLVGDYLNATGISFSDSDNLRVEDYEIRFDYAGNESLEGSSFEVSYSSADSKEEVAGLLKGYSSNDSIGIIPISTNVDTVRCLDAILRVILITLRDTAEEKNDFMLQTLEFGDLQPVITEGETVVFGRPCTMGYQVNNSVSFDLANQVKEIILKRRNHGG